MSQSTDLQRALHTAALATGALFFSLAALKTGLAYASHRKSLPGGEAARDEGALTPPGKPVSASVVQVTYTTTPAMCFSVPSSTDPRPAVLSGPLLKMIDIVASVAARRHAGVSCVTVSVDAVLFLKPIFLGELIHMSAAVNRAWGSSMEIGVKLMKEDPERGGQMTYVSHSYLTFVAVETSNFSATAPTSTSAPRKHSHKFRLPPVLPETALELRRYRLAGRRRARRIEMARKASDDTAEVKSGVSRRVFEQMRKEVLVMSSATTTSRDQPTPEEAERQRRALDELELEFIARAYAAQEDGVRIEPSTQQIVVDYKDDETFARDLSEVKRAAQRIGIDPGIFALTGDHSAGRPSGSRFDSQHAHARRRSTTVSLLSESMLSPSAQQDAFILPAQPESPGPPARARAPVRRSSLADSQPVSATLTRSLHMVFPEHCNSNGVLFGGQLMGWMEEVALMACRSLGHGQRFSTVALDGLEFKKEVQVGETVLLTAVAVRSFAQSVETYVVAEAETRGGERRVANEALFTAACASAAALQSGAERLPLLQVTMPPGSALEQLQHAADGRRHERLAMRDMLTRLYGDTRADAPASVQN